MTNQSTTEVKSDPKGKAIISLVLGIISGTPNVITVLILVAVDLLGIRLPMIPIPPLPLIFFPVLPFISIIGLLFGIMSFKSTKRNFAISGIILSLIGLVIPLYYFVSY